MADARLTATQKILYGVIYALHNEKGYCYATNTYLGSRTFTNRANTSRNIKALEEHGYLKSEIQYADTKEVEERKLYPLLPKKATPRCRKEQHPVAVNGNTPVVVNDKGISKDVLVNNNRGETTPKIINDSLLSELQKKYPKLNVRREWEKASSYAEARGKVYKNHAAYLRNWLIKSQEMYERDHPQAAKPLGYTDVVEPKFVDVDYAKLKQIRDQVASRGIGRMPDGLNRDETRPPA